MLGLLFAKAMVCESSVIWPFVVGVQVTSASVVFQLAPWSLAASDGLVLVGCPATLVARPAWTVVPPWQVDECGAGPTFVQQSLDVPPAARVVTSSSIATTVRHVLRRASSGSMGRLFACSCLSSGSPSGIEAPRCIE